ncbi:deoxyribonuclease V [Caldovatus aquaticus]|uniref:Endonuclease V n=1 Tax=Caldovatus aquaticus TaxID=2865671 RepID=A0ABS7EZ66_9PROT|nr:deoxyribonuclease V [Caldovatus aquaticus]MBW8268553.1 deoxyribonuclease V [Caldovatus aquaticus]
MRKPFHQARGPAADDSATIRAALRGVPPEWIHPPDLDAARAAQRAMAERVIAEDAHGPVARLGGADTSAERFDPEGRVHAALVTLDAATLAPLAEAGATGIAAFPYIPGFLGFREVPTLLAAWARLDPRPDLVMVDGHGVAHPRGLGIASHFGVLLDVPTIGVAKSVLVGAPEEEVGPAPGARANLVWRGRVIGVALRTRARARPVYVSVGHRVSLEGAVAWVLRACAGRGYRLPEPTRLAHRAANRVRRGERPG